MRKARSPRADKSLFTFLLFPPRSDWVEVASRAGVARLFPAAHLTTHRGQVGVGAGSRRSFLPIFIDFLQVGRVGEVFSELIFRLRIGEVVREL